MSMQTEILYGIGLQIPYKPTNTDIKNIRSFLNKHKNTLLSQTDTTSTAIANIALTKTASNECMQQLTDLLNSVACSVSAQNCAYAIVSNIFALETNIRLQIDIDHDEETAYMVFAQTYPWYYTETEKNLTIDHLTTMLIQLRNELKLNHSIVDNLRIEHFG